MNINKLTLDDVNLQGKRVLVRVDFNVPLDEHGNVREFTRIKASLPTIHNIIDYDGSAVLMSHFGRPNGQRVAKYSLKQIVHEVERLLGIGVKFADDCIGKEIEDQVNALNPGEVILLENVRYHPGEKENDADYAEKLARMGEIYVNDAFGAAHRKQASIHAITQNFPGCAVAGRLMMRELRFLSRSLLHPQRPFIGVIGGAKISSKLKTIKRLLPKVDKLLIGGGMAYTIIKAKGEEIGDSIFEPEQLDTAREIVESPDFDKIVLPIDSICAQNMEYGAERKTFKSGQIPKGWKGLDLGREARQLFVSIIKTGSTILWNGPMGYFEREPYAPGTRVIARALVDVTAKGGTTIVGGGDTMAAIHKFNLIAMTHISTGGGSLLEFMEGKVLPGVEALTDQPEVV